MITMTRYSQRQMWNWEHIISLAKNAQVTQLRPDYNTLYFSKVEGFQNRDNNQSYGYTAIPYTSNVVCPMHAWYLFYDDIQDLSAI